MTEKECRDHLAGHGRHQELPEPGYEEEIAHARESSGKGFHWWLNALEERLAVLSMAGRDFISHKLRR
jgi:hypothetical protein